MISNISFGSTYNVSNKNNKFDKFSKFQEFAFSKENEDNVALRLDNEIVCKNPEFGLYNYYIDYTFVAPDSMDNEIETFCLNNGINFLKYTNDNLTDIEKITSRIKSPEQGMVLANVNAKKLENLIQTQSSNIEHCKNDYNKYFSDSVDYLLKSGKKFPATTLYIDSTSSVDDTLDYIANFGADNLNPGQLFVDFVQKDYTQPDHCTYFALRDMGMPKIPVYMNEETFIIADALGILE